MVIRFLIYFCFLMVIKACKPDVKTEAPKTIESDKNTLKPKYDIDKIVLTDQNVVDFLMWYGDFNPETDIVFQTKFGDIEVQLYQDTPLHRANMIYLIKKKYFDTTFFHRVVDGFVVQGGNSDEMKTSKSRKKIGKYTLPPEFKPQHQHDFGVLCAARSWVDNPDKKSTPYEFYFVHNRKGEHHLNNEHTVFGKITKGLDVLDEIARQDTDKGNYPLFNIYMKVVLKK